MKAITLLLIVLFCLAGCKPQNPTSKTLVIDSTATANIEDILSNIDCSGSGYCYLYNSHSIKSELKSHTTLYSKLDSDYVHRNTTDLRHVYNMRFLIKNHNKSTLDYIDSLGVNKDSLAPKPLKTMMAVKPPNPCPIGKTCLYSSTSISYYTINPEDSCNVYKNSSKIKVADTNYDKETSIKTFNYASPIKGNKGDRITVKYSVTYPTAQGTVSENGTYTEVVE